MNETTHENVDSVASGAGMRRATMLTTILDNNWTPTAARVAAIGELVELVRCCPAMREWVFDQSIRYWVSQHIDDAFPSRPNIVDVLAALGPETEGVIEHLVATIKNDTGIPRWDAAEILAGFSDARSETALAELVREMSPITDNELIHAIERYKGKPFIVEALQRRRRGTGRPRWGRPARANP